MARRPGQGIQFRIRPGDVVQALMGTALSWVQIQPNPADPTTTAGAPALDVI